MHFHRSGGKSLFSPFTVINHISGEYYRNKKMDASDTTRYVQHLGFIITYTYTTYTIALSSRPAVSHLALEQASNGS